MSPEESPYRKLLSVAALLGTVLGAGVLGYIAIEGWGPFDALYMTVITLGTVGYGETHPLSPPGRIFTIVLILTGGGALAYAISNLTAFFVEGELTDAWRRSRMQNKINEMKDHYILCGVGHSGRTIMEELLATGRPVVVLDIAEPVFQDLLARKVPSVLGDATRDETLKQAGIERAKGLFASLGSDRDNAFVVLTARGLNPRLKIVVEQVDHGVEDKLIRSGADAVVQPSRIGGLRMASVMVRPAVVSFLDTMLREGDKGRAFRIEEISIPRDSPFAGRPIGAIRSAEGNASLVLAVKDPGRTDYVFNPSSDRPLGDGEVLVVMGTVDQNRELARRLSG